MLKTFALIVRRPDHSREEFRRHYEEIHAPLGMQIMEGIGRYVRYHVDDEIHGKPIFDVISGFWYGRPQDAAATVARLDSEAGEAVLADELTFMDKPRNEVLLAPPVTRRDGEEGEAPVFVLVRAPADRRDAWLADYDAKRAPALLTAVDAHFAVEHSIATMDPGPPSWDRVTEIASEGLDDLPEWISGIEAEGAQVLAVRTRLHETETEWELPA